MRSRILGSLAAVLLAASLEAGATPYPAWDAGGNVADCRGETCGIQFTPTIDLTLYALGAYLGPHSTLSTEVTVGIWDIFGNLLRSATITAADLLVNGYYRYESVAPLLLEAGAYYIVGAWEPPDGTAGPAQIPTNVNPNLTNLSGVVRPPGGEFGFPGIETGRVAAVANFLSTPEPMTLALLGIGLAGLGFARRKR